MFTATGGPTDMHLVVLG